MKKSTLSILGAAAMVISLASCSGEAPFLGQWEGSPKTIQEGLPPTATGTSTASIHFMEGTDKTAGKVTLEQDIDLRQSIPYDNGMNFEIHVAGKVSTEGRWTYDVDDDDDLLLTFDANTIKVDIDTNEVVCNEAADNEKIKAACDELKEKGLPMWKSAMEGIFRHDLSRYAVISDISKGKDGNTLTFEIEQPEEQVVMQRK